MGSQGKHVELKRRGNDALFEHVAVVVCGDDPTIRAGKPAPDIYLAAAAHLGVDPTRCVEQWERCVSCASEAVCLGFAVLAVRRERCGAVCRERCVSCACGAVCLALLCWLCIGSGVLAVRRECCAGFASGEVCWLCCVDCASEAVC